MTLRARYERLRTTMTERARPIWKSATVQFERERQWLISRWRTALRVVSLCVGLGLIVLCIIFPVSLWNLISFAWSWYSTEVVSKDGTPSYPNAGLINPVIGGVGAGLLVWAALQQAATARRRHKEQTDADRQRRITESYSKAVEQLACEKMAVCLGGIYTLERISRESPADYWTVMETLAAFVRERARSTLKMAATLPPTDIAAVLTVIVRRLETERKREWEKGWRLHLRGADLRGANLSKAHLEGAELREAHLEGARLWGARLNNAHLEGAILRAAHLEGANFFKAHLEGADLNSPYLSGANLEEAFGDAKTRLPDGFPRPAHWLPYEPDPD